jgi:hypothetical protein
MKLMILLAVLAVCIMSALPALATTWDAAAQFDEVLPNGLPAVQSGPWIYGVTSSLSSGYTVTPFDYMDQNPGIDHWRDYWHGWDVPCVLYNQTNSDASYGQTVSPHTMAMHPGPNGEFAITRWTAQVAGTYTISGSFFTLGNPTTDGHVLINGTSYFSEYIDPEHPTQSFTTTMYLAQNSTVDFALGYGENQNYSSDCTMFAATISNVVPEPGSLLVFGSGLLGMGGYLIRRRR